MEAAGGGGCDVRGKREEGRGKREEGRGTKRLRHTECVFFSPAAKVIGHTEITETTERVSPAAKSR